MRWLGLFLLLLAAHSRGDFPLLDGGHLKGRGQLVHYPDDSVFREPLGATDTGAAGVARLRFGAGSGAFTVNADYQLIAQYDEAVGLGESAGIAYPGGRAPDDQLRWWDLTHVIEEDDDYLLQQRLDRLNIAWTGEKAVVRFGRQAVSWGNGLIYTPMDFLNPFDPAAVDTEYKVGDDMLYAQYLLDSGDDLQFVNVQRRDAAGDVIAAVSSSALKYHAFGASREFDLLLAQHYDDTVIGAGGLLNVGEAVLRGDLVLSDSETGWVTSLVVDWSWSFVWGGRNVSAVGEYFFNGFGLRESEYAGLVSNPVGEQTALLQRLARSELFTIGRHYAAGSLLLEWTPLLNFTGNLFYNLGDGSTLAQVVAQWDAAQDWQVLGALNLPLGPAGTEYGGLRLGEDLSLAQGPSLFVQVAWYF